MPRDYMVIPSETDTLVARRSSYALSRVSPASIPEHVHLTALPEDVVIPRAALPLIAQILEAMSRGERVRLFSESREVSPQQAATILGVSRPFLVHLLDSEPIPYRYVGTHRRIPLSAVL